MADFLVVGVSHRSGTAALREALYVEEERQPELLRRLRAAGLAEAVFLSTCDRSEVQAVASDADQAAAAVETAFAGQAGVPREEVDGPVLPPRRGRGAAPYLRRRRLAG